MSAAWVPSQSLTWRVDLVVAHFSNLLDIYDAKTRLDKYHVPTINRLHALGDDPHAAVNDAQFMWSLLRALGSWHAFRGLPGVQAPTLSALTSALTPVADSLAHLAGKAIDDPLLDIAGASAELADSMITLAGSLGRSSCPLVLGSKTLHHLLPSLVPPMDRENSVWFFAWRETDDLKPPRVAESFVNALDVFHKIAVRANPAQYVTGAGYRTSVSKLVDNAICASR